MSKLPTVILKPGKDARIASGYLWVFSGDIARLDGHFEDGGIVDVRSPRGTWLGRGFINSRSALAVRVLTTQPESIDDGFWRRRVSAALAYRQRFVHGTTASRLIYSEGDFLPGLIVDRYGDVLAMQTLALGMDQRKAMLADLLMELAAPAAIYERNDASVRRLEGLESRSGWLRGEGPSAVEIAEGGARFIVELEGGQKTGFYLDQRENRLAMAPYVPGAEVLDVFCYTGAFAVHAALAGARSVTAIDSSADAVAGARNAAILNQVEDRCEFIEANAFDALRALVAEKAAYDTVILDPPPFAPTKESVERAAAGYKEINLRALRLLRPGGILVTCSCSYHVGEALLLSIVAAAAADAHRRVRLIESRGQARDHPVHPAMPETQYLTCLVLEGG
ncbi:MAG TPA: class I SAM-dependent rRNA methyltransferase [bacterium]|nr:class I SAM-dependent rRNA methyltransferase [bacterium]